METAAAGNKEQLVSVVKDAEDKVEEEEEEEEEEEFTELQPPKESNSLAAKLQRVLECCGNKHLLLMDLFHSYLNQRQKAESHPYPY